MEESLLAAARGAVGFMPDVEGLALHDAGLAAAAVGPLLEIGTYCGKSASPCLTVTPVPGVPTTCET